MPFQIVPLERAKDWPDPMHQACDLMEAAAYDVANANGRDMSAALERLTDARAAFGWWCRRLDMKRRPEMYAK